VGDEVIGVQVLPVEARFSWSLRMARPSGWSRRISNPGTLWQGCDRLGAAGTRLIGGLAAGRKNDIVTLYLAKAAPKMTRLDAAPLRKRSAVRGEAVVDVRAGDGVAG